MIKKENVKTFVRNVLGCKCPEQVFEYIECQNVEVDGLPLTRINVGNRLLLYVVEVNDVKLKDVLPALVRAGKNERDDRKFNRFRLVVVTDDEEVKRIARESFENADVDEGVHLHVLGRDELK